MLKSQAFLFLPFLFHWSIIDLQYYSSFRYTTKWFDIFILYKMIIAIGQLLSVTIQRSYNNIRWSQMVTGLLQWSFLWVMCFVAASLCLTIPFTYFSILQPPSILATTNLLSVWAAVLFCLFICFVFQSLRINGCHFFWYQGDVVLIE